MVTRAAIPMHRRIEIARIASSATGVPMAVILAVIEQESDWRPWVTGGVGEIGLGQLKLTTAQDMGYEGERDGLYDPQINVLMAARYISWQLGRWHTMENAISAYNAGHPIAGNYENYVEPVLERRRRYEHILNVPPATTPEPRAAGPRGWLAAAAGVVLWFLRRR